MKSLNKTGLILFLYCILPQNLLLLGSSFLEKESFSDKAADCSDIVAVVRKLVGKKVVCQIRNFYYPTTGQLLVQEFYFDSTKSEARFDQLKIEVQDQNPLYGSIRSISKEAKNVDSYILRPEGVYHKNKEQWRLVLEPPLLSKYTDQIQWLFLKTIPVYATLADHFSELYEVALSHNDLDKSSQALQQLLPIINPGKEYVSVTKYDGEDRTYHFEFYESGMIRKIIAENAGKILFSQSNTLLENGDFNINNEDIPGNIKSYEAYVVEAKASKELMAKEELNQRVTGMVLSKSDGDIEICKIIVGSPADKSGLQIGDRILAVNDIYVTDKTIQSIQSIIRKSPISKISIKQRDGTKEVFLSKEEISTLRSDFGLIYRTQKK